MRFLGYTKDADGHLVIDPAQAEIVKRIYREYLEGKSMDKIAAGLEADGILTGAGKAKWHTSTINKILRNEKYMGDALLQKTYTTDFLTKKRIKNNGTVPQYYVEGNHEAIIPKDIFLLVQEELLQQIVIQAINQVICQKDDYDSIADEILRLRDMRKQAEVDSVVKDEQMRLIQDLQDFIKSQPITQTYSILLIIFYHFHFLLRLFCFLFSPSNAILGPWASAHA